MPSTLLGADSAAPAVDTVMDQTFDEAKTLISAVECNLYGFDILNLDAAVLYIHFFDKAAVADVTIGTTVPDLVLPIAASANKSVPPVMPLKHFSNGCVALLKTVNTTAGTTGPTADAHAVFYKK
jgi:hypothetical protein